jgi:hypothetical protein
MRSPHDRYIIHDKTRHRNKDNFNGTLTDLPFVDSRLVIPTVRSKAFISVFSLDPIDYYPEIEASV